MFFELLSHLVALDLTYFYSLILFNLHWLFAFMAAVYFFTGGKKLIRGFFVVTMNMFALSPFLDMLGLVFFVGSVLIIFYIVKFFVLVFAESSPRLSQNLITINEVSAFGTVILFNIGIFAIFGMGGL